MYLCGYALVSADDRRIVVRAAAVAAGVLGVWCAFERAGRSLIGETFAGHRVGGPFGQPAYVGAIAVLLLPLSVDVALDHADAVLDLEAVEGVSTMHGPPRGGAVW